MSADLKILLGIMAALLSIAAHVPYTRALLKGTNKPHIFTWIIWTVLTCIACAAQIAGNAGPGAWSTAVTVLMCLIITALTFRHGSRDITRSDWCMFIGGLAAIPVWMLTSNPLWAVLIVTAIDALAFAPTWRKSWSKPYEEEISMYGVNVVRHMIAITALSQYALVTALYPAMLLIMNAGMYAMLRARRARS